MDKFQRASPMNSNEETRCESCNQIIFEKEMFMICQIKEYKGEIKLKNYCCDCFQKKIDEDIERVQKWSRNTIQELGNMIAPIQDYMISETKKQIDNNRKMLKKIEGEGGL
jgi:formylmethanofuran dehydrogenase subunit C